MMSESNQKLGHIGVLMGGISSERDISLKSGKAVYKALCETGCRATAIDIQTSDPERIKEIILHNKIDVAFIALHGRLGEDGTIQALLDELGIPYPGSGIQESRLALNKVLSHRTFQENNIPVPRYEIITKDSQEQVLASVEKCGGFPVVVKPANEGSSIGITIVHQPADLDKAVELALSLSEEILIEAFIDGIEVTVGIVDGCALSVVEICPKKTFFDFTAKYQDGKTEYVVPARIPADVTRQVQEIALSAHTALGCAGFSRVDIILSRDNKPYVLEVNTIPGFTATSLLPKAAGYDGLPFEQLCITLVKGAYGKSAKEAKK